MDQTRIQYLVGRYLESGLTEPENAEFGQLLQEPERGNALQAAFEEQAGMLDMSLPQDELLLPLLARALNSDRPERPPARIFRIRRWQIAAAVLIMLGAGFYTWNLRRPPAAAVADVADIPPGRQGAILTLGDGSQVLLDSMKNGVAAIQKGMAARMQDGSLVYEGSATEAVYNIMTTPKGKQFHLLLPDGTGVWLNASSSVRYPTVFNGKERRVEITGEVYFEVSKNGQLPFRVSVKGRAEVEVLGTRFNINAYDNEPAISTTLLEGKVRVHAEGERGLTILPGQQARLTLNGDLDLIRNADGDKVMAWKNGLFYFNGATLQTIMREVERWYDITVVYENGVPDVEFEGKMTRGVTLKDLMSSLEKLGVRSRLKERTLIIMK